MKKRTGVVAVLALFFLVAGTASAEMYVEGYVGSNFTITSPNPVDLSINPLFKGPTSAYLEHPRTVSHFLMGGAKLGIWFSKEGFPRYDFPDWMKYVGFYLDFSHHGIHIPRHIGSRRMYISPSPPPLFFQHYKFVGNGNINTVAFMFAVRYGFRPTEKVPFGKWQPYAAVGPAIMITSLKPTFLTRPNSIYEFFPVATDGAFVPSYFDGTKQLTEYDEPPKSTVSLAFAAEVGMRFMIRKFLSLDTSIKYRYTHFSTTYNMDIYGFTHQVRYSPQFNIFSIQAGVAYHF